MPTPLNPNVVTTQYYRSHPGQLQEDLKAFAKPKWYAGLSVDGGGKLVERWGLSLTRLWDFVSRGFKFVDKTMLQQAVDSLNEYVKAVDTTQITYINAIAQRAHVTPPATLLKEPKPMSPAASEPPPPPPAEPEDLPPPPPAEPEELPPPPPPAEPVAPVVTMHHSVESYHTDPYQTATEVLNEIPAKTPPLSPPVTPPKANLVLPLSTTISTPIVRSNPGSLDRIQEKEEKEEEDESASIDSDDSSVIIFDPTKEIGPQNSAKNELDLDFSPPTEADFASLNTEENDEIEENDEGAAAVATEEVVESDKPVQLPSRKLLETRTQVEKFFSDCDKATYSDLINDLAYRNLAPLKKELSASDFAEDKETLAQLFLLEEDLEIASKYNLRLKDISSKMSSLQDDAAPNQGKSALARFTSMFRWGTGDAAQKEKINEETRARILAEVEELYDRLEELNPTNKHVKEVLVHKTEELKEIEKIILGDVKHKDLHRSGRNFIRQFETAKNPTALIGLDKTVLAGLIQELRGNKIAAVSSLQELPLVLSNPDEIAKDEALAAKLEEMQKELITAEGYVQSESSFKTYLPSLSTPQDQADLKAKKAHAEKLLKSLDTMPPKFKHANSIIKNANAQLKELFSVEVKKGETLLATNQAQVTVRNWIATVKSVKTMEGFLAEEKIDLAKELALLKNGAGNEKLLKEVLDYKNQLRVISHFNKSAQSLSKLSEEIAQPETEANFNTKKQTAQELLTSLQADANKVSLAKPFLQGSFQHLKDVYQQQLLAGEKALALKPTVTAQQAPVEEEKASLVNQFNDCNTIEAYEKLPIEQMLISLKKYKSDANLVRLNKYLNLLAQFKEVKQKVNSYTAQRTHPQNKDERYQVEKQTNDLLGDLKNGIPTDKGKFLGILRAAIQTLEEECEVQRNQGSAYLEAQDTAKPHLSQATAVPVSTTDVDTTGDGRRRSNRLSGKEPTSIPTAAEPATPAPAVKKTKASKKPAEVTAQEPEPQPVVAPSTRRTTRQSAGAVAAEEVATPVPSDAPKKKGKVKEQSSTPETPPTTAARPTRERKPVDKFVPGTKK